MNVNFRVATLQDQEAIKTISKDVYQDTDTLSYDFTQWLKSDMWFLFVGEVNSGRVVAFTAINITGGGESLVVRSSRVDAEYRGQGVYKALVNFAFRFIRERNPQAKFALRLRSTQVRVPNGYDILEKIGLLKTQVKDYTKRKIGEFVIEEGKGQSIAWHDFKVLYDSDELVKNLFANGILKIHCDCYDLKNEASWKCLQTSKNVHLMLTRYEDDDGKAKVFMSFLRLETSFTNMGIPMVAMNIFGLDRDAMKCHIVKGLQEVSANFGSKFLIVIWVTKELLEECAAVMEELLPGESDYKKELNLLFGDFSKNLEDVV